MTSPHPRLVVSDDDPPGTGVEMNVDDQEEDYFNQVHSTFSVFFDVHKGYDFADSKNSSELKNSK